MYKLKNKIKRHVPSSVSCRIKQLQMMHWLDRPYLELKGMYNQYGEVIRNYFLYDGCFRADYSATKGRYPRYIFWDRSRSNLKYHFYTDDLLFTQKGKPVKKFGLVMEPDTLQPKKYKTILKDIKKFSEYDIIFSSSQRLLDKLPNAKPLIMGGVYVGTEFGGGTLDPLQYEKKNKNISLCSSDKRLCSLHEFRYQLAKKYEKTGIVDCFGTFNGGKYIKIWDSLADYRYSFAIENAIEPYWITEKICNCFASMTVPIYLGSPKIGDFFNIDGIVVIKENDFENIDKIILQCNENDYLRRLDAIKDNYERVKKYLCLEDWLFKEYGSLLP